MVFCSKHIRIVQIQMVNCFAGFFYLKLNLIQGKKVPTRAYVPNLTLSARFGHNYYDQRLSNSSCAERKHKNKIKHKHYKLCVQSFPPPTILSSSFPVYFSIPFLYLLLLLFLFSLLSFSF